MNLPGLVTLTTDFGLEDGYVGAVKGVIASMAPAVRIIDITHHIAPQDVRGGAYALMQAAPLYPEGTVHVAVVDPGVGTARRPLALAAGGQALVGPDNGLLSWAARALGAGEIQGQTLRLAGKAVAVVLDDPRFWRPKVSTTFHGRDIFAPVAAHLANGTPVERLGSKVAAIAALPWPSPEPTGDGWLVEVVHVDHFGNLITSLSAEAIPGDVVVEVGEGRVAGLAPHYQQAAPLVALIGSDGLLEIAAPNGSAAAATGLGVGARLRVRRR